MGPGLFGVRRDGSDAERLALARRFALLGEPAPVYVLSRSRWTDRSARLLIAGTNPDGGPTLTTDHLARLVQGFDAPIPILSDENESVSGCGYVTAIECGDAVLDGTITLSAEAEDLLWGDPETVLSIRLTPDLARITEVTLASEAGDEARLFPSGPSFRVTMEARALPTSAEAFSHPTEPSHAEAEAAAAVLLLPEEAAFYRRHSPVSALGEVLSRRF